MESKIEFIGGALDGQKIMMKNPPAWYRVVKPAELPILYPPTTTVKFCEDFYKLLSVVDQYGHREWRYMLEHLNKLKFLSGIKNGK